MKFLVVESNLVLGFGHMMTLAGDALIPGSSVQFCVLLDPGLLPEGQVTAVAMGAYYYVMMRSFLDKRNLAVLTRALYLRLPLKMTRSWKRTCRYRMRGAGEG